MAAADFPNAPSVDDVFTIGDKSWKWTGTVWQLVAGPGPRQSVGTTPPSNPVAGDQWFNSNTASQYVYYDGYWVEVGAPHRGATQPSAYRNAVVNGSFDVWQRGAGAFTTGYSADQWNVTASGSSMSVTRQAFTLGNLIPGYEPTYYLRSVVTSVAGAANWAILDHKIEGVRSFAGQAVTLSFWAKADAVKNVSIEFYQHFGTGGSPSAGVSGISSQTLIPLTTSWQRYQVTVAVPSILGKTLGTVNDDFFRFFLWMDGGSNYISRTANLPQQSGTFDFWGFQLETGSYATEYENRPVGVEFPRCQRYFQRISATSVGQHLGSGQAFSTTAGSVNVPLAVTMRNAPTVTYSAASTFNIWNSAGANTNLTSIATDSSLPDRVAIRWGVASGMVGGNASMLFANGACNIDMTAEL